ncbi:hypothetical protein PAMA_000898 [Pampus argenteus]
MKAAGESDSCQQRDQTEEQQELHSSSKLAEQGDDLCLERLVGAAAPLIRPSQKIHYECLENASAAPGGSLLLPPIVPRTGDCRRISHSLSILISCNEREARTPPPRPPSHVHIVSPADSRLSVTQLVTVAALQRAACRGAEPVLGPKSVGATVTPPARSAHLDEQESGGARYHGDQASP